MPVSGCRGQSWSDMCKWQEINQDLWGILSELDLEKAWILLVLVNIVWVSLFLDACSTQAIPMTTLWENRILFYDFLYSYHLWKDTQMHKTPKRLSSFNSNHKHLKKLELCLSLYKNTVRLLLLVLSCLRSVCFTHCQTQMCNLQAECTVWDHIWWRNCRLHSHNTPLF